jgi:Holliday junction resolvasome RuvABC endonuclease subunit
MSAGVQRILGIDPGLQRTGFGSGAALARLHVGCADMSLHRIRCA